nr:MAG TPA: hypothetical protein [Caudoviricetes sp.]
MSIGKINNCKFSQKILLIVHNKVIISLLKILLK